MKERPEQRAARWVHYDRRIQELVDDYQNYANKIFLFKSYRILNNVTIKYYYLLYYFTAFYKNKIM